MKTTVELADPVYRQVEARAASAGLSMPAFLTEAVREKLERDHSPDEPRGWRAVFGTAPADEIREIQERLDTEFSQIRVVRVPARSTAAASAARDDKG